MASSWLVFGDTEQVVEFWKTQDLWWRGITTPLAMVLSLMRFSGPERLTKGSAGKKSKRIVECSGMILLVVGLERCAETKYDLAETREDS